MIECNDNGGYAGERGTPYLHDCNCEYAGKLGTPYRDWHTTYRNVPTPLYGACP